MSNQTRMSSRQQRPPRSIRLQGGFVISQETAIEWANRLAPIKLTRDDMSVVWQFIERRISPKGVIFSILGDLDGGEFMVVTQKKRFVGEVGMDPNLIPQFQEGNFEARARQMLDAEGSWLITR
jgi:hypothetical protein